MRAILIPADNDKPMEEVQFSDNYETMISQVMARFPSTMPEMVRTRSLHALMWDKPHAGSVGWSRYPTVVMLVDDDGLRLRLSKNSRATMFYDGDIVGDALLFAEVEIDGSGDLATLPDKITIDTVAAAIVDIFGSGVRDSQETVGQDVEPV